MSEFTSGFIAGAFCMFGFGTVVLFVLGACKVAGEADDEAERIRLRMVEPVDQERVL